MKRILAVLTILGVAAVAHAQIDRASLTGSVRDASGAVITDCTIAVTNIATNVTMRIRTTGDGNYLAPNLPPGKYRVEAEAPGFEKKAHAIILDVGVKARIDFTLAVGQVTEVVTVEEATRPLNTESATLGTVIDQSAIANLPLAIRNWDDLLVLVPGVQGDRYTDEGGGTSFGRTGGVNIHGQRSLQNNFLLDGVDNNSISENVQELSTQVSRPSIDSIQQFKIVTSGYSAEYGRSPGGAISVSTKSGTNRFSGTAYEYFRNQDLDTINYFSKAAGQPKPANNQNVFGGNIGGPILKDKAFFFVDYEGTRITKGVTRITSIPTANQRAGIFTRPIRDPVTGQLFANNTIPADRIDPVAAGIIALLPLPNQPGANNWFRQPDLTDDANRIMGRIDIKASNRDNIFLRYIYSSRDRFAPGHFGGIVDGTSSSALGGAEITSNGVLAAWTRTFSPSIVNEFRFSWVKSDSDAFQEPYGQAPPPNAVVPGVPNDPLVAGGVTRTLIDTFFSGTNIGSPDFLPKFQHTQVFEFIDYLTWIKGSHQFKFGADIIAPMQNDFLDVPATRGRVQFRGTFTAPTGTAPNGDTAMADFLLGYVSDASLTNVYPVQQRHWATSFFVNDDWKVTRKLTINLGVRYDFITPALEAQNRQTNFNPAGTGSLIYAEGGSSLEERGLVAPDTNNIAPRLGIVFQVNEKTVLRGGYGIFYNLYDRVGSEDQLSLNVPGLVNNVPATATPATGPLFLLKNGFPANFLTRPNLDPAAGQLRRVQLRAVTHDAPKTQVQEVSVGVQREFLGAFVVSLDGIWTWGSNLATLVNLNQPLAGTQAANGPLPYPNFGFIEWRQQNGTSSYKGLDLSIQRQFQKGFGFGIAYTLGKSTDNTAEHLSVGGSNSFPQDADTFLTSWEGPSDYDVLHRFVTNFTAELPFGKNKKWATEGVGAALFGNWTFSAIYTYHTGRPFTVNQGNNNVGTNMYGLPDLVGDPTGPQTPQRWFDPAAFRAVASGAFGNEPRNSLRGPAWQSFDFSLQRNIGLGKGLSAQLRWDVFNLFNTTNFGIPNRNISAASTVATITTLAGDPRTMQLAIRLMF